MGLKKIEKTDFAKEFTYPTKVTRGVLQIYKEKGEPKHIYHVKDIETCDMKDVALAIYAMLHERGKKKIILMDNKVGQLDFYPDNSILDIYMELTRIDMYYLNKRFFE